MTIYRGWRILAVLNMPRAYEINDVLDDVYNSVKFGNEVPFHPRVRPENYGYTMRFIAIKGDLPQEAATSISGLKKRIDEIENNS